MSKLRGNRTLTGTWGEIWVDGELIAELSKIEVKVSANREDVQLDIDVDSKMTGIKGEFTQNGFKNDLKHEPGVLSMARTMMPNSAGSQFFIMHKAAPHLDGAYAAFGKVIEGIEVVNKIADVATDRMDKPLEPQVMKKVTVETFGVDYPEPEKC